MIVLKLISTVIKQNLGLECSNFYFKGKKNLYIIFVLMNPWAGCRAAHGCHFSSEGKKKNLLVQIFIRFELSLSHTMRTTL